MVVWHGDLLTHGFVLIHYLTVMSHSAGSLDFCSVNVCLQHGQWNLCVSSFIPMRNCLPVCLLACMPACLHACIGDWMAGPTNHLYCKLPNSNHKSKEINSVASKTNPQRSTALIPLAGCWCTQNILQLQVGPLGNQIPWIRKVKSFTTAHGALWYIDIT